MSLSSSYTSTMSNTTIFHNPACGTSRNTLAMIRSSGVEPISLYTTPGKIPPKKS